MKNGILIYPLQEPAEYDVSFCPSHRVQADQQGSLFLYVVKQHLWHSDCRSPVRRAGWIEGQRVKMLPFPAACLTSLLRASIAQPRWEKEVYA